MRKKLNLAILLVTISAFAGLTAGVYSQISQTNQSSDAPTVVDRTQPLAERQKEHAKLHGEGSLGRRKIESIIEYAKKNGEKKMGLGVIREKFTSAELSDQITTLVQTLTKKADAVVIGTIIKRNSQITSGDNFLFSDYTVRLESLIKSDNKKLTISDDIVVTSLGGKILLDGVELTANDSAYPNLEIGKKYLFFLSTVKATNSYQPVESSTLLITQNEIKAISEGVSIEKGKKLDDLIGEIYSVLAQSGGKSNE